MNFWVSVMISNRRVIHSDTLAAAGIEPDVLNLEENSEGTFISSCMRSNHWRLVSLLKLTDKLLLYFYEFFDVIFSIAANSRPDWVTVIFPSARREILFVPLHRVR